MISELIKDLKAHRRSYIDCNPIFARLAGCDLTRFHYLAYLRETYHLVKHTAKYLTIAANRVAENDERLSAYFRKFCLEETGHELLCIRDIDALGENVDIIISGDPNPGAWGIVTQCDVCNCPRLSPALSPVCRPERHQAAAELIGSRHDNRAIGLRKRNTAQPGWFSRWIFLFAPGLTSVV